MSAHIPIRSCAGCRGKAPRAELVRFVLREGVATPDPRRRLPGRGAWLHDDPACRALAERSRGLQRSLRPRG